MNRVFLDKKLSRRLSLDFLWILNYFNEINSIKDTLYYRIFLLCIELSLFVRRINR
jgi:hypothetical protein